jgi:hypothetical protein
MEAMRTGDLLNRLSLEIAPAVPAACRQPAKSSTSYRATFDWQATKMSQGGRVLR